jgi:hypothetical protein
MLMERVLQGSVDSEGTSGIRNDVSIHLREVREFFLNFSQL